MPWVFLCLVLANTVYFGWKFVEERPASNGRSDFSVQGQGILLLSEKAATSDALVAAPKDDASDEDEPSKSAVSASPVASCFYVGPFGSEPVAKQFGALMREKGYSFKSEARKVEEKDVGLTTKWF